MTGTSNWSNFGRLSRRAGLSAIAGLSCLQTPAPQPAEAFSQRYKIGLKATGAAAVQLLKHQINSTLLHTPRLRCEFCIIGRFSACRVGSYSSDALIRRLKWFGYLQLNPRFLDFLDTDLFSSMCRPYHCLHHLLHPACILDNLHDGGVLQFAGRQHKCTQEVIRCKIMI